MKWICRLGIGASAAMLGFSLTLVRDFGYPIIAIVTAGALINIAFLWRGCEWDRLFTA